MLVMSRCQEIHDVEPFKTMSIKPWGNAATADIIFWPWNTKGRSVLWCWTPFSASNTAGKDNSDFGKALWRWALYPASNTAEKNCQESGKGLWRWTRCAASNVWTAWPNSAEQEHPCAIPRIVGADILQDEPLGLTEAKMCPHKLVVSSDMPCCVSESTLNVLTELSGTEAIMDLLFGQEHCTAPTGVSAVQTFC